MKTIAKDDKARKAILQEQKAESTKLQVLKRSGSFYKEVMRRLEALCMKKRKNSR